MVGAVAGQWERELLDLGFEHKSPQKGAGMGGATSDVGAVGEEGLAEWLAGLPQPLRGEPADGCAAANG